MDQMLSFFHFVVFLSQIQVRLKGSYVWFSEFGIWEDDSWRNTCIESSEWWITFLSLLPPVRAALISCSFVSLRSVSLARQHFLRVYLKPAKYGLTKLFRVFRTKSKITFIFSIHDTRFFFQLVEKVQRGSQCNMQPLVQEVKSGSMTKLAKTTSHGVGGQFKHLTRSLFHFAPLKICHSIAPLG